MTGNQDKRVWITIDTEMDADAHWKKSWPPEYTSVCEGIPKLLRPIWNRYHVHPIYFVSPEVVYIFGNMSSNNLHTIQAWRSRYRIFHLAHQSGIRYSTGFF